MIKLTPAVTEMLSALKIERGVEVVQILLPVLAGEEGWEAEKWWDAGKALHEYLHAHEVAVGNRRVYKNTVVVAIGSAKPKHVSASASAWLVNRVRPTLVTLTLLPRRHGRRLLSSLI